MRLDVTLVCPQCKKIGMWAIRPDRYVCTADNSCGKIDVTDEGMCEILTDEFEKKIKEKCLTLPLRGF